MTNKLRLDKKDKKLFKILRFFIFVIFILGSIYFAYRILFPSEYFTYSFRNTNSLKNTITNVSESQNSISFFTSTPQDFSKIKIDIELEKKSTPLENTSLNLQKSYKSFFYPESSLPNQLPNFNENLLAKSAESIFIITQNRKYPIDNPLTFKGLGYNWDNIEAEKIDLSEYEKKKLLNITSIHPDGTILATDEHQYHLIEENKKRKIDISQFPNVVNFKNNILVQEASLNTKESCQLKNNFIFQRKYSCIIPTEKIIQFFGKDYRFELSSIPKNTKIKKIDIEFQKTPTKDNLFIFLADIKNKIKARFTGQKL